MRSSEGQGGLRTRPGKSDARSRISETKSSKMTERKYKAGAKFARIKKGMSENIICMVMNVEEELSWI